MLALRYGRVGHGRPRAAPGVRDRDCVGVRALLYDDLKVASRYARRGCDRYRACRPIGLPPAALNVATISSQAYHNGVHFAHGQGVTGPANT